MNIFTIGYEGLNYDKFLTMLKFYKITFVADVRQLPSSRKKGFSKTGLKNALAEHEIKYENFRDLGVPKAMRDDLKQTKNYRQFFTKYKISLKQKLDDIDNLLSIVYGGEKVALMCFEKDVEKCHRKALAEELKHRDGNGLEIKHLKVI